MSVTRSFPGPGDDTVIDNNLGGILVGGDGDDSLVGNGGNDFILGDHNNIPVYGYRAASVPGQYIGDYVELPNQSHYHTNQPGPLFYFFAVGPEQNPDEHPTRWGLLGKGTEPSGDDTIEGGTGQDTIYGGPGADHLSGGPRGETGPDWVFGEAGPDLVTITADIPQSDAEASGEEAGFWPTYAVDALDDLGKVATKKAIEGLGKAVLTETLETFAGGFIFGAVTESVANLAKAGIASLFEKSEPVTLPPSLAGNDILIYADFDPREDVFMLPLSATSEIDVRIVTTFDSVDAPPPPYGTEYGETSLEFFKPAQSVANGEDGDVSAGPGTTGDVTFARVVLSSDFLGDIGLVRDAGTNLYPTASEQLALFRNIVSNKFVVGDDGTASTNLSGVTGDLPTDPSAYADGTVPEGVGDPDTLDLVSATGGKTLVFGAWAPISILNPYVASSISDVVGTHYGDYLNVNGAALNPARPQAAVSITSTGFKVFGFDGDDIIVTGRGIDNVYGGDGDDILYDWGSSGGTAQDVVRGNAGDDLIYTGIDTGLRQLNGNAGSDTVDFSYLLASGLVVDLGTPLYSGGTGGQATVGTDYAFELLDIENVTGSPQADVITGDAGDNVFGFSLGDDTIVGGGGTDVYSFETLRPYDAAHLSGVDVTISGSGTSLTVSGTVVESRPQETVDGTGDTIWDFAEPAEIGFANYLDGISLIRGSVLNDTIATAGDAGDGVTIDGAGGDDLIAGGSGAQTLIGGEGDDVLTGGPGGDTMFSGVGQDYFVDTQANFNGDRLVMDGYDVIYVPELTSDSGVQRQAELEETNGVITVTFPDTSQLTFTTTDGTTVSDFYQVDSSTEGLFIFGSKLAGPPTPPDDPLLGSTILVGRSGDDVLPMPSARSNVTMSLDGHGFSTDPDPTFAAAFTDTAHEPQPDAQPGPFDDIVAANGPFGPTNPRFASAADETRESGDGTLGVGPFVDGAGPLRFADLLDTDSGPVEFGATDVSTNAAEPSAASSAPAATPTAGFATAQVDPILTEPDQPV